MTLDEEAWSDFTELLASTLDQAMKIQTEAMSRMAEKKTKPIPVSMAIAGYESARPEG